MNKPPDFILTKVKMGLALGLPLKDKVQALTSLEKERERVLFYASTQVWAYGGCLRGNMSLHLQGVYLWL